MITPPYDRYTYPARLIRVIDGDGVYVKLDLGFGLWQTQTDLRLLGIDAPEMHGESAPEGEAARSAMCRILTGADELRVHTHRDEDGKYGRTLATIYARRGEQWTDVNQQMIDDGHAVPYEG